MGRFKKPRRERSREKVPKIWNPCTELGHMVKSEKIDSLDTIWARGKIIKEPEIVDFFLSDLEERILQIGKGKRPFRWVQRMTDSGRRSKYVVAAAVGNKNGYVGVGVGRAKEYGTAINSAIRKAKLSLLKIDRGCGSWDCGCKEEHSIATEATGKCGSVTVKLIPAPQGTGLTVSSTSRDILELGGVHDIWSVSKGHTKTRTNTALAIFEALKELSKVKLLKPRIRKKKKEIVKEKVEGGGVEGSETPKSGAPKAESEKAGKPESAKAGKPESTKQEPKEEVKK